MCAFLRLHKYCAKMFYFKFLQASTKRHCKIAILQGATKRQKKAWPDVSVFCHLDGLLLNSVSVLMQGFVGCLAVGWQQQQNSSSIHSGGMDRQIRFSAPPPFFSVQEKSGYHSVSSSQHQVVFHIWRPEVPSHSTA